MGTLGGTRPTMASSRVLSGLTIALFIATAFAGSSTDEPSEACTGASSSTNEDGRSMFTSGAGSSACTAYSSSYYSGNCNNANGEYTITTFSDSACSTVTTSSITTLPGTITLPDSTTVYGSSCGACPKDGTDDYTVTYIGAFFGCVFAYVLMVCLGMYLCFLQGATCGN